MSDHDAHDHTGVPGVGTPADILDIPTAETDDTLVLAPDGLGGVEFRAETGGGGTVNDDLPWDIEINPLGVPATSTNWSTIVNTMTAGALYTTFARESTGAQNAEVGWDIVMAAGTWDVEIFSLKQTNFGIVTISIDGVSVGTIDLYATPNSTFLATGVLRLTGVTVATLGKKRLLLKMATKNASSSSYFCDLSWVRLYRTA